MIATLKYNHHIRHFMLKNIFLMWPKTLRLMLRQHQTH